MKLLKLMGAALCVAVGTTTAYAGETDEIRVGAPKENNAGEVGYPQGALGYDALVAKDYKAAIEQIEGSKAVADNDPAVLINLGQAYAKTGRMQEGRKLILTALHGRKHFDLVLADGKIVNSRDAAQMALRKMDRQLAAR